MHAHAYIANSTECDNQPLICQGAASLCGVGLILSERHPVGMSAPSSLCYNRGEGCHGEQEFVYSKQGFTFSDVVLTEEFLVEKKEREKKKNRSRLYGGKTSVYNERNLLYARCTERSPLYSFSEKPFNLQRSKHPSSSAEKLLNLVWKRDLSLNTAAFITAEEA